MNQMIQGSVKLIKKDSKGKSLRDIEFVITSSDGAEVAKAKTDSAGEDYDDVVKNGKDSYYIKGHVK